MTNGDKMPELIDRDLTIHELEAFKESCIANLIRMSFEDIIDVVKEIPTIDAKPVRRGRWIPTEYDSFANGAPVWDKWECSECGHEHNGEEDTLPAFCQDCGTYMREGWVLTINHWIPCSERLPETDTPVICYMRSGQILVMVLSDDDGWYCGVTRYYPRSVTHWAYLPEPPKGEQK